MRPMPGSPHSDNKLCLLLQAMSGIAFFMVDAGLVLARRSRPELSHPSTMTRAYSLWT